jgi:hypothetical protein
MNLKFYTKESLNSDLKTFMKVFKGDQIRKFRSTPACRLPVFLPLHSAPRPARVKVCRRTIANKETPSSFRLGAICDIRNPQVPRPQAGRTSFSHRCRGGMDMLDAPSL